jgi:hypothetical protein
LTPSRFRKSLANVHHGGAGRFREVQDDEWAGAPGVRTCTVGHDLDGGLALLGGLGQVAELSAHHFVAVELQQHPDVAGRRDGVVGLQRRAPQLVSTRVVWAHEH